VRFLSPEKAKQWVQARLGTSENPATLDRPSGYREIQFVITGLEPPRLISLVTQFLRVFETWLQCLMWIRDPGLGNSDLNLYYQLRSSYHDHELLEEAPGHLFLEHEVSAVRTFILVCILNAWDADILPDHDYVRGHVSHDGWLSLASKHDSILQQFEKIVVDLGLQTRRL
jgi:hypothetical protein